MIERENMDLQHVHTHMSKKLSRLINDWVIGKGGSCLIKVATSAAFTGSSVLSTLYKNRDLLVVRPIFVLASIVNLFAAKSQIP